MSSALEMMPPAPENTAAASSEKTKGILRMLRVHDCVSRQVLMAEEGENVDDVIPRGSKIREVTKAGYEVLASAAMMCAPTMNGYREENGVEKQHYDE